MYRSILKLGVALMLALPLSLPTSAQAKSLKEIKESGTIRVGMDAGLRPYAYRDNSMQLVGADVSVAQKIAKDLGVKLDVVELTSPNRVPFLVTGKVDIVISTLAKSPDRTKVIDFTKPYSGSSVVVTAPKSLDLKGMDDLAGKTIAVTRGTTYDQIVTKEAPKSTRIVRFDSEDTEMTALTSGQLEIGAHSIALLPSLQKSAPSKDFVSKFVVQQVLFRIGVPKGNDKLRSWLDDWISDNLKSGWLDTAYKNYVGSDLLDAVTKQ